MGRSYCCRRGLVRLLANGQLDAGFSSALTANNNVATFAVTGDDRIYVALYREQVVARLLPHGGEEPSFTRQPLHVSPFTQLHVLPDGRLIVVGSQIFPTRPVSQFFYSLTRWSADGTPDPTYPILNVPPLTGPASDGSLFLPQRTLLRPDGSRVTLNLGHAKFENPSTNPYPVVFAPDGRLYMFGNFDFHHGTRSSRIVRINRVPAGVAEVDQPPKILTAWADPPALTLGETTTLRIAAVAAGPVTYEWRQLNSNGSLATSSRTSTPTFAYTPQLVGDTSRFSVRVLNGAGEALSSPIVLTVLPATLQILAQPTRIALAPGRRGSLYATVNRHSQLTSVAWLRDGIVVARDWSETFPHVTYGENTTGDRVIGLELGPSMDVHAGEYWLELTTSGGEVVRSAPIQVVVEDTPRFVNLSTRAFVGEGERAVVLGFVIPPGGSRALAVRGIGPSLARFGVANPLQDARLEMFDHSGRRLSTNDHWREYGASMALPGAFPLSLESKDAMIVNGGLAPGSYTVRLSGPPGLTGEGLIEIYEIDDRSERFVNISTRAFLDGSASPVIAGFAVRGTRTKRVLVRAAGPALGAFGVRAALANPRLTIRDANGAPVATNDDWSQQSGAVAIAAAATAAGAFPFSTRSPDAALLLDLPPGDYTAIITAPTPDDTGVVLVEVYEVP